MTDGEKIKDKYGEKTIVEYFLGPHGPNITKVYIESEKLKNSEGLLTDAVKLTIFSEMHGSKRIKKELLIYIANSGELKIIDDIWLEK